MAGIAALQLLMAVLMEPQLALPKREVTPAILRGLRGQCPSCGEAKLFARWLKPHENCPHCHQDWTHQRADDFPAYLVILLLGHIIVALMVEVNLHTDMDIGIQMAMWPLLTILLACLMLQPAKGAVIAVQWALRMDGFGKDADQPVR